MSAGTNNIIRGYLSSSISHETLLDDIKPLYIGQVDGRQISCPACVAVSMTGTPNWHDIMN